MMNPIGGSIRGVEQMLLHHLQLVNAEAVMHATRISTGKMINRPSDDPAGYFQLSRFEQRLDIVQTTKRQVDLAANIGAQAQLVVDEIRTQLDTIRDTLLTDEGQELLADERAAQQEVIDVALNTINTLSHTEINGERFLDGSKNFSVSGQDREQLAKVQAYGVRGDGVIAGTITAAATRGTLTYSGSAGTVDSGDATFTVSGKRGSATISVSDGDDLTEVRNVVNSLSHSTGITATLSGDDLIFETVDFGDEATIEIAATTGTFDVTGGDGDGTDAGTDVEGVINGLAIPDGSTNGNRIEYSSNGTRVSIEVAEGYIGTFSPVTVSSRPTLKFRLTTDITQVTEFGLAGMKTSDFQGISGSLDQLLSGQSLAGLGANTSQALRVVDEAIGRLTLLESQVNAFTDITTATASALLAGFESTLENSIDSINQVDEEETSLALTDRQLLASNTQSAIALVQQQQLSLTATLRQLAGLF